MSFQKWKLKDQRINIPDIKFNPIHTQLPDFNWNIAAEILFINENILSLFFC